MLGKTTWARHAFSHYERPSKFDESYLDVLKQTIGLRFRIVMDNSWIAGSSEGDDYQYIIGHLFYHL